MYIKIAGFSSRFRMFVRGSFPDAPSRAGNLAGFNEKLLENKAITVYFICRAYRG